MAFRAVAIVFQLDTGARANSKHSRRWLGLRVALPHSHAHCAKLSPDGSAALRVGQVVAIYFVLEGPIAMYIALRRDWRRIGAMSGSLLHPPPV